MENPFGKANYSGNSTKSNFPKRIKRKETSGIFRIIPPIKSCAESGTWYVYHAQHFGYFLPSNKPGGANFYAPFECVEQKNKDRMVVVECPECALIAKNKEKLASIKEKLEATNGTDEDIENATKPLVDWLESHSVNKRFWVNVMTEDGKFGFTDIPVSAMPDLKAAILEAQNDYEVDPLDENQGCWFKISQVEGSSPIKYTVKIVLETQTIDGKKFQQLKPAPLSPANFATILGDCADLRTDVTRPLSQAQIKALTECSGDPTEVQRIMGVAKRAEASPAPKKEASPPPTPAKKVVVEEMKEDDEEALLKKIEALRAAKAAKAKVVQEKPPVKEEKPPVKEEKAPVGKAKYEEMSDDDFKSKYGIE